MIHLSQEYYFKRKKIKLIKNLNLGDCVSQPVSKLRSLKVCAKYAVSSKHQEEKLLQILHQASLSLGRSPGSGGKCFFSLSFWLISCPVPVASEVSSPLQEQAGGSMQA